jgi:peptide/nickel transport system ATP-binding protein
MSEALLSVVGLSTHFATREGVAKAVDDVTFSVGRGEVLGLVGESGSGKSTTAHSILGLVEPPGRVVAGRILFGGRDLAALSEREMRRIRGNRIAMIFPDPMSTLNPVLRIDTQMIEAILAHEATSRSAARDRARAALGEVGIASPEERLMAYPHQFSGGMRQRVAIAIALLNRPDLIIADEPTIALDATAGGPIRRGMRKLASDSGAALIWITQDPSVIAGLAERVGVMYAGRIVEYGATADVLGVPRHPYTGGLLASIPGDTSPRERLKPIPGTMPPLTELPAGCHFRPRCSHASAECGEVPKMRPWGAVGQSIRCFHPLQDSEQD